MFSDDPVKEVILSLPANSGLKIFENNTEDGRLTATLRYLEKEKKFVHLNDTENEGVRAAGLTELGKQLYKKLK